MSTRIFRTSSLLSLSLILLVLSCSSLAGAWEPKAPNENQSTIAALEVEQIGPDQLPILVPEVSNRQVFVSISPSNVSLQTKGTEQFSTSISGSRDKKVTWLVNGVANGNSTYGTISENGKYTAPATVPKNAVTVTAKSVADNSKSASASVKITAPVSVGISPKTAVLQAGVREQFAASVSGSSNTGVVWSVDGVVNGNSTYGGISVSGMYTAPTAVPTGGAVTITATSAADKSKSASASVTITAASKAVSVKVSPSAATVAGGGSEQFAASVTGTTNTGITWLVNAVESGNATYGTISSSGLYVAPACSSVSSITVTARSNYDSSVSATATVSITAAAANSNMHYVATSGSDSNDGSACRPWATITHATDVMNPGDTITVADGVYPENLAITRSGSAAAPIVIKSQNKWGAKIVPVTVSGNLHYFSGANYVTLQDFEFTSSGSYVAVIKIDSGQHDSIIGNKIHDTDATPTCSSGHGVLVADSYNTIQANMIYNVGPPRSATRCNQNHGIYITAGSYGTVADNLIMQVYQGLAIHMAGNNLSNWTIANNTVVDSGTDVTGSGSSSGGPEVLYCEGGTCDYNTYSNNIFANTQGGYCFIEQNAGGSVGSHNQYLNNLLSNCGSNIFVNGTLQNTITSDPQFVNYTGDPTGDYRLDSTSPAVDHGTSVGCPSYDADYWPRPTGSACDIGAFEFHP